MATPVAVTSVVPPAAITLGGNIMPLSTDNAPIATPTPLLSPSGVAIVSRATTAPGVSTGGAALRQTSGGGGALLPPAARKIGPDDFVYGTLLGEGAYARVLHCRLRVSPQQQPLSTSAAAAVASTTSTAPATAIVRSAPTDFAVKVMEKRHIKKENKTHFVMMERSVLSRAVHPCIVRLCYTF